MRTDQLAYRTANALGLQAEFPQISDSEKDDALAQHPENHTCHASPSRSSASDTVIRCGDNEPVAACEPSPESATPPASATSRASAQSHVSERTRAAAAQLVREIQRAVGDSNYRNWFDAKTRLTVTLDQLTVGVGSPFLLSWMQKQFRDPLQSVAELVLGPTATVKWDVDADTDSHVAAEAAAAPSARRRAADQARRPTGAASQPSKTGGRSNGGRRFADLTDFVEGSCNQLAVTAARQVCDSPAARFNPLFVHGPVGTGKTHLLEGIYRGLRRTHRSLNVTYITAEAFANYFTQALREHSLPSFRQRFRNVDVLLVDDIDFLDSKRVMQEEFLHTYKRLDEYDRQVILSSDRHPKLLTKLSDELTSRFVSGLVCRLEPPDATTRLDIVRRKAAKLDGVFSDATMEYVADRFRNNVRELEGALNVLDSFHSMSRRRVELAAARKLLSELERDCIRVVKVKDVERTVCDFFGLDVDEMRSSSRQRTISQPRMLAMYLARKHTQAAYREIGQHFGGRNHSTVVSAEKKIRTWMQADAEVQVASRSWPIHELLESLEQHLQAG
ncbi:MAG: chromosomal replication initiator protein DnaA [Planctomycetota bacterium]|nr:chromosomal replication initiator protein DnaA [Planctomycetota bacterium]